MNELSYSRVARMLHWAMGLLIILNLIGGIFHEELNAEIVMPLHKATGILLLGLAVLRILWRLTHRPPPLPENMAGLEKLVSHLGHFILYAMMVIIPLSGWIMSSASRWPISFYGLFDVMKFAVSKDDTIVGISHEAHELLGYAMIGLLVLHVAAALRHHFVLKDGVMRRMLG